MKRKITSAVLCAVLFTLAAFSPQSGSGQNNLSSFLTTTNFGLYDASNNALPFNEGDDPRTYSGAQQGQQRELRFSWSVNTGNTLIKNGDYVNIPFSFTGFNYVDFTNTPLLNTSGNKIGEIRKSGSNLRITFSDHAVGRTSISGSFKSGYVVLFWGAYCDTNLLTLTFNGEEYKFAQYGQPGCIFSPTSETYVTGYGTYNSSSSAVRTQRGFFYNFERFLSDPAYESQRQDPAWVDQNMRYRGVFLEDSVIAAGVSNVNVFAINLQSGVPVADTNPTQTTWGGPDVGIRNKFSKIEQLEGESIDSFRIRVKSNPLQYGVHKEGDTYISMVWLGDWPNDSLTAQKLGIDSTVIKYGDNAPHFTDIRKQYWLQNHAANNVVGGAMGALTIYTEVIFENPVALEAPVITKSTLYLNDTVYVTNSLNNTLKPNFNEVDPTSPRSVRLVNVDSASSQPISGLVYSLERFDGTDFVPYKTMNGDSLFTTNDYGVIQADNIANGTYRFVQDSAAAFNKGYDFAGTQFYSDASLSTEITTFEIDASASSGLLIYAINKRLKTFTVTYKPGEHGAFADDVHPNIKYGSATPAYAGRKDGCGNPLGNPDYEFDGWDKMIELRVTGHTEYTAKWVYYGDGDCRRPLCSVVKGTHTDATCTPMNLDGVDYPVVLINGHCWTRENLRKETPGSMVYDTKLTPGDESTYGRLYTQAEAADLCPSGWHLPTSEEVDALMVYDAKGLMNDGNWLVQGSNISGFTAQPGGIYNSNTQRFEQMLGRASFITADNGEIFTIGYHCCSVIREPSQQGNAYGVRCVKDNE